MSIGKVASDEVDYRRSSQFSVCCGEKKIYVPEKKIILIEQMSEQESKVLMGVSKNKGGLIV